MSRSLVVNTLWVVFGVLVTAVVIGLVTLWPEQRQVEPPPGLARPDTLRAEVVGIARAECPVPNQTGCRRVTVELLEGAEQGEEAAFTIFDPPDRLTIELGDGVRVAESALPAGAVIGGRPVERYSLADFERRAPLGWLLLVFVVLVLATGRWKGARAIAGLAVSLAVIVFFVVPAILEGASPPGVALVGALAIMLATLTITHGFGAKLLAAALGTTVALLLTLGLGTFFVEAAHLTGLSSEEAVFIRASVGDVSVQALLLAGMVIGALGVLDDLTVSQASTVLALRHANPALTARQLFRSAVAVGQDHVAATVNTLVLAYAGAALPVLILFSLAGTSFGDAVNGETVAAEIVATLVGSIGLVSAVPVTTGIAAMLAVRLDAARLAGAGHVH